MLVTNQKLVNDRTNPVTTAQLTYSLLILYGEVNSVKNTTINILLNYGVY